jgi:hypothetical protein
VCFGVCVSSWFLTSAYDSCATCLAHLFRIGIDIGTKNLGRLVDVWESYQRERMDRVWGLVLLVSNVIACQSCATCLAIVLWAWIATGTRNSYRSVEGWETNQARA